MMLTIQKLLLILIFSGYSSLYAIEIGNLSGKVTSNDQPVDNVLISIKNLEKKAYTDSNGNFTINDIPSGIYQVHIKKIGYHEQYKRISIAVGQALHLPIELQESITEIKGVKFTTSRINTQKLRKIDLQLRPLSSSQDLLKLVPGLFIAQHAGGGKAEQIFLRGFDVDHGTDFAIYVDGMPVNMPSHAHGQGYADLHFLIPETVSELEVNKGPHATRYGDLATAGSGEFKTLASLDKNMARLEYGMFDTRRALLMMNLLDHKHLFSKRKENIYIASEYKFTNSYFNEKQDFNRVNVFMKYLGELNNGDKLSISMSTFQSKWDASGQIPDRKVFDGSITRYGSIDPTEGGKTGRSNLNIQHEKTIGAWVLKNQVFYNRYDFNLFSNFTFYLNDSINGDQIYQADHRNLMGLNSTIQTKGTLFEKELSSTIGAGLRYDNSSIQLNKTIKRDYLSTIVNGKLNQIHTWLYMDEVYRISNKWKLNIGTRADVYNFDFRNSTYDTASGNMTKGIISPKLNVFYVANKHVQWYAKSGFGFHSNDARAVIVGKLENTLARAFGNEIGSTFKPTKRALVNIALWSLDLQSELVYVGDEGIVEALGRTRRFGIDFSMRYQLSRFLFIDGDLNLNRGRLRDEPSNANRIPLAPSFTSIGGISYKKPEGFNGSLRYRFMGDRPAIEDHSIIAQGYFLTDAVLNYQYKAIQVGLSIENIFDYEWKEAQFATESKLREESNSVNEIHFTPGTPRFVKIQFTCAF